MRTGLVLIGAALLIGSLLHYTAQGDDQPASLHVAAPEFAKVTEWHNSPPLKIADLKGQVVALHFWTFG
jgi:hypothetical protein